MVYFIEFLEEARIEIVNPAPQDNGTFHFKSGHILKVEEADLLIWIQRQNVFGFKVRIYKSDESIFTLK